MGIRDVYDYYSRDDVKDALLRVSRNREIVGVFKDGRFDSRPNMLLYSNDIVQMCRRGVVSFHGSVERWSNPMSLSPSMSRDALDELRTGWDLMLDLDVKLTDFEFVKNVLKIYVDALGKHGIKNISCKYTGGKSFHIAVPFESFPDTINYKPAAKFYPEAPEAIVKYLNNFVVEKLETALLRFEPSIENIALKTGVPLNKLVTDGGLDTKLLFNIREERKTIQAAYLPEAGLFTSRHMFRLPYSLNESSLLVSVPVKISDIDKFQKEDARPENVAVKEKFLYGTPNSEKDATNLLVEALDWTKKAPEPPKSSVRTEMTSYIPESYFPSCIKQILGGMSDGRKRSVFILISFLLNMNWPWNKIEETITAWNAKNQPPLPVNYVRGQLRWFAAQKRKLLPPNCASENFYKSMGIQCADDKVKNPVTYATRKYARENRPAPPAKPEKRKRRQNDEVDFE